MLKVLTQVEVKQISNVVYRFPWEDLWITSESEFSCQTFMWASFFTEIKTLARVSGKMWEICENSYLEKHFERRRASWNVRATKAFAYNNTHSLFHGVEELNNGRKCQLPKYISAGIESGVKPRPLHFLLFFFFLSSVMTLFILWSYPPVVLLRSLINETIAFLPSYSISQDFFFKSNI